MLLFEPNKYLLLLLLLQSVATSDRLVHFYWTTPVWFSPIMQFKSTKLNLILSPQLQRVIRKAEHASLQHSCFTR